MALKNVQIINPNENYKKSPSGQLRVVSRAGFGPKLDKNFGLNSGLRRDFCLRCTKM